MTRWFTSDLHLRHRLVNKLRGYVTPEGEADFDAHSEAIAEQWDSVVKKNDEVFILGDLSINSGQHVLDWMDERIGRKHLFGGNHDSVHPMHKTARRVIQEWWPHFETIQSVGTVQIAGQKVMLSHFPFWSWGDGPGEDRPAPRYPEWRPQEVPGQLLIHGHTHGNERAHDNQFHVGWDAWGRLVHESVIEEWVKERVESGHAFREVRQ